MGVHVSREADVRPRLDGDGRLIPPASRPEGVERVKQLRRECAKIEGQLADPTRAQAMGYRARRAPTPEFAARVGYYGWRTAATEALRALRDEERQLSAWLQGWKAASEASDELLEQAYDALAAVEEGLSSVDKGVVDALEERLFPGDEVKAALAAEREKACKRSPE